MKIGVMVESFRRGLEGGIDAAAELGVRGVQLYARGEHGDLTAWPQADQAALARRIAGAGLEVSALVCNMGGYGLEREDENPTRVDRVRAAMDLAGQLACPVVSDHIGVIPDDRSHKRYPVMARAAERIARCAESAGVGFAIETGPERPEVLKGFMDDVASGQLGVNMDPANLAMVFALDAAEAVDVLQGHIIHTHAKDGVNLQPVDAEKLYHSFAAGGLEGFHAGDYVREVPLGEGGVDFPRYLQALKRAGYDGYLTVEREVGDQPQRDVEQAVTFLRELIDQM